MALLTVAVASIPVQKEKTSDYREDHPVVQPQTRTPQTDVLVVDLVDKRHNRIRKRVVALKLARILMEHIEIICSLEPQLSFVSICSIGILSRTPDIDKSMQA